MPSMRLSEVDQSVQRSTSIKIAPPRDRNSIRKDVYRIKKHLRLDKEQYVDIIAVLELMLPVVDPQFLLLPVEDRELAGRYAEFRPEEHTIYVKQSVYDAAYRGGGWARMILAHEFGHYVYHDSQSVAYAYLNPNEHITPDIDPERQADIFAAEFLAPSGEIKGLTPQQVQRQYGVSALAAKNQLRQADKIERHHKWKKKKRSSKKPDR